VKKLKLNFDGITDPTGYLFSFTKCLSAALKHSPYAEVSEDIIATSGFAFRMWVDKNTLCPSAMSMWEFKKQKPWAENGGLVCDYVERLWGQDNIEEERRLAAIEIIKKSIDSGVAAVAWDISGCEWGLITGYDDGAQKLFTLKINGSEDEIGYSQLGKLEIPIMSVLTVMGKSEKPREQIFTDTVKLAVSHNKGEEWCDNAKGLNAYPALITFITDKLEDDSCWSLEYYLGTYASLKYYARKYFEKHGYSDLAELYRNIYTAWKSAFDIKVSRGNCTAERAEIAALLKNAYVLEKQAFEQMLNI
jgi:hypothetical protein